MTHPSEKYDFVNWDDENPNHQPEDVNYPAMFDDTRGYPLGRQT